MKLIKRYFDSVGPDGSWLIAYDAVAKIGPAPIRYRAVLGSDAARSWDSLTISERPGDAESLLALAGVEGRVEPGAGATAASGPIGWTLDGMGRAMDASGRSSGGYLETVRLDAWPWRLGVKRIRWGRVIGRNVSVVWNIVEGEWPLSVAVVNGETSHDATATADTVTSQLARVDLGARIATVHEGDVMKTQLRGLAPLIGMVAGGAVEILQDKHVREACITLADGRKESGVAMDETVEIGKRSART